MSERFAYVGTMPCGCIVAACVDDPRWKNDTSKEVARWIKEGYTVSRVSLDGPQIELKRCIHKDKPVAITGPLFSES